MGDGVTACSSVSQSNSSSLIVGLQCLFLVRFNILMKGSPHLLEDAALRGEATERPQTEPVTRRTGAPRRTRFNQR